MFQVLSFLVLETFLRRRHLFITVFALGFNLYALRKAYSRGEQSAKVMALRKAINQVLFSITLLVMVFTKVFILHS